MQTSIGRMTLQDMPQFWQHVQGLVSQKHVNSLEEDALRKGLSKRMSTLIGLASLNALSGVMQILKTCHDTQMGFDGDTGPRRAFEVRFSYFVKHSSCSGDRNRELEHLAKCHMLALELAQSEWGLPQYQQMVVDCIVDWIEVSPLSVCCACVSTMTALARAEPAVFEALMKQLMRHTQTTLGPGKLQLLASFVCSLSNNGLPIWSADFENALAEHLKNSIYNWSQERVQDEIHSEGLVRLCQINGTVGGVVRAAFSKRLAKQARGVSLALKSTQNVGEAQRALKEWTRLVQKAQAVRMLAFDSVMRRAILDAVSECVEICMEPGGKLSECLEEVQRMQWNLVLLVGGNSLEG